MVGSIEPNGALRVRSRERAGRVGCAPGEGERLEPDDVVTVVGTQPGLAEPAGRQEAGGRSASPSK
jgi:hypothetical protein